MHNMGIFISTYINKLDDKNRLSVPAPFRSIIEAEGSMTIYGYCSFINNAIEVCTEKRMRELQGYIEDLDIFSLERDALETAILGGAELLNIDSKGRIVLPERLIKFGNIKNEAAFVGKGKTFEIWSIEEFPEHSKKSRDYAISKKITLKQKRGGE
ncbi:cell division protein MraZ [endosymbiont of Acanthamoeba sp. UWC8]|uniref:division/cell wall cluster transcriptional repressor MraZ n=1 Tax=endosymbiont of Acanthamoeba sp. UWC8 TaxID=86106 RepID=UPI0004D11230|nr:hypothetical protein [endosymbiont of Acanthamoeba sp. UWC8]AIF81379.1 cell division protein MraZ [endosymbiont of Acanthamoeba sp. UWC8]